MTIVEFFARLMGLPPEQVWQYGLVGIALFAIILLTRLMLVQANNQSKILDIQASLDKSFDKQTDAISKQTTAIDGIRAEVALSTQTAKATQPFLKGLVDSVREFSTDTTTAVMAEANRVIDQLAEGRGVILDGIGKGFEDALKQNYEHSDHNRDLVIQEVKLVAATTTTIDEKVTKLAPFGEIFYRVEENLRIIGQTLDKAILLAAVSTSIAELRTDISTRLTAIEADVKTLHQAAEEKAPSFDVVPTQSAAIKHKTEPIPPMPSAEAVIVKPADGEVKNG